MTERLMNNESERIRNDVAWCNLRYYPRIYLEGLRKAIIKISQDSQSPGQDLNSGPLKYEAGVLTTWMQRLVSNNQRRLHMSIQFPKKWLIIK
jgi:hypothetical protein